MIGEFGNFIRKSATHLLLGIAGLASITFAARLLHLQPDAITNELGQTMAELGEESGGGRDGKSGSPALRVSVEGTPREIHPILRDDIYRIAREALRNAFPHAQASKIEADITYSERLLRLRIRDDGKGIDRKLRERAEQIRARFDIWSEVGAGTEVELRIPGSVAYGTEGSAR